MAAIYLEAAALNLDFHAPLHAARYGIGDVARAYPDNSLASEKPNLDVLPRSELVSRTVGHLFPYSGVLAESLLTGIVTFTFDDGRDGQRTMAADILKANSIQATAFDYVSSLQKGGGFLTVEQLSELQNHYGWEIGGHSYTHAHLNSLSREELRREIVDSRREMISRGFDILTFAYPYGEGNNNEAVKQLVMQNYAGARGASITGQALLYGDDADAYNMIGNDVVNTVEPATVRTWIDEADLQAKWLVLIFHQIVAQGANWNTYYLARDLQSIASYAKSKVDQGSLRTTTFRDALEAVKTSLGPTHVGPLP